MNEWIPALTTTGVLATVVWLGRNLIITRLKAGVQHEFDAKLEALRAQSRVTEEGFKADLRAKEAQIAALRGGALSAFASRQAAIDKRRLEAIDQLWQAMIDLGPAKGASVFMSVIKYEPASKEAAKNPRFRQAFEGLSVSMEIGAVASAAARSRPYLSPIAWALFAAYQAIVSLASIQLFTLQKGLDAPGIFDPSAVTS